MIFDWNLSTRLKTPMTHKPTMPKQHSNASKCPNLNPPDPVRWIDTDTPIVENVHEVMFQLNF